MFWYSTVEEGRTRRLKPFEGPVSHSRGQVREPWKGVSWWDGLGGDGRSVVREGVNVRPRDGRGRRPRGWVLREGSEKTLRRRVEIDPRIKFNGGMGSGSTGSRTTEDKNHSLRSLSTLWRDLGRFRKGPVKVLITSRRRLVRLGGSRIPQECTGPGVVHECGGGVVSGW